LLDTLNCGCPLSVPAGDASGATAIVLSCACATSATIGHCTSVRTTAATPIDPNITFRITSPPLRVYSARVHQRPLNVHGRLPGAVEAVFEPPPEVIGVVHHRRLGGEPARSILW
jgi:hypothetical protein